MICSGETGNSGTVLGVPAAGTISEAGSEAPVSKGAESSGERVVCGGLAQDEMKKEVPAQTSKAVKKKKKTFIFINIGM
jgi:hypothetical protein